MRLAGRLCETGEPVAITVEGPRITSVESAAPTRSPGGSPDPAVNLGGPDVWITPGFIDLQVNGYGGYNFNRDSWTSGRTTGEAIARIVALAARAGVPLLCPTVVTGSHAGMVKSIAALAEAMEAEPDLADALPSIHVEGPYLCAEDGPRGAHPREHIRDPDWTEFQRFQEAAGGRIKLLTLAPELPGAVSFIEKVTNSGVVVSLGHTGASPRQLRDAVRAGARLSTHLGNGAHAQLARHPNYIWEQLANDMLSASIIADGHHLPPAVVKCFSRVKGSRRLIVVSDAVALGGCAPGRYDQGRHEVLPDGKVVLAGTPYLAGAGHLLDTGVANLLRCSGWSLDEVVRAVTANPAHLLGLGDRKGQVTAGYDADLTLFRLPADLAALEGGPTEDGWPDGASPPAPLQVVATLCRGRVVFRVSDGAA